MTPDTRPPVVFSGPRPGADGAGSPAALPELPSLRCADAARMRGEPLRASAVRYSRFLLLEVPGPWGDSALDGKHMDAGVGGQLARAAKAADTHVLLIRRPAVTRRPGGPANRSMAWAFADTSAGAERVLWGAWRDPADLLDLDLTAAIPGPANAAGPQRLALVCTNGKRDQCCALRGRPVAAAIAAATDWDTWECSHLGGHRFAATMMLLPTGDMFGWMDPESALEVMQSSTWASSCCRTIAGAAVSRSRCRPRCTPPRSGWGTSAAARSRPRSARRIPAGRARRRPAGALGG